MLYDVVVGVCVYLVFLLRHPTPTECICHSKLQHMHAATPQLTKPCVPCHSWLAETKEPPTSNQSSCITHHNAVFPHHGCGPGHYLCDCWPRRGSLIYHPLSRLTRASAKVVTVICCCLPLHMRKTVKVPLLFFQCWFPL